MLLLIKNVQGVPIVLLLQLLALNIFSITAAANSEQFLTQSFRNNGLGVVKDVIRFGTSIEQEPIYDAVREVVLLSLPTGWRTTSSQETLQSNMLVLTPSLPSIVSANNNNLSPDTIQALRTSGGSTASADIYSQSLLTETLQQDDSKSMYPTVVIPETLLHGCSDVDSFFDLFLKKNAKYSLYDKFLQSQGDTNMKVEEWAGSSSDTNQPESLLKRTVKYLHPLNVPMAPSQASARREQIMRHYGVENGVIVESKTFVDDVPMADCFYSAERMIIVPGAAPNSISIIVDFGVKFLKKTIIKSMITKSANHKVSALYKNMIQYIQESLAKEI